jgi:LytS/YehU family sensor histidine kinase
MCLSSPVPEGPKHGLEPKLEGGRIEVIAQQSGDRLTLEVRDTGMGLGDGRRNHQRARNRAGARQTRREHGKRAALKLGNQVPSGTVATIELPFRKT